MGRSGGGPKAPNTPTHRGASTIAPSIPQHTHTHGPPPGDFPRFTTCLAHRQTAPDKCTTTIANGLLEIERLLGMFWRRSAVKIVRGLKSITKHEKTRKNNKKRFWPTGPLPQALIASLEKSSTDCGPMYFRGTCRPTNIFPTYLPLAVGLLLQTLPGLIHLVHQATCDGLLPTPCLFLRPSVGAAT